MATVVFNGPSAAYLLSDAADLSAWPQVTDGSHVFIVGLPFTPTIVTGVYDIPADCPLSLLVDTGGTVSFPGYAAWKNAQVTSQQAALAAVNAPIVSASYKAGLQRQAAALQAKGDTAGATALYLKAAGVPT